jgi:hypothetical protein
LAAILRHFRQRRQREEEAYDKLRAQEFIMGAKRSVTATCIGKE